MSEKKKPSSSPNSPYRKTWWSLFQLLIWISSILVVSIAGIILFKTIGHSFEFNLDQSKISTRSTKTSNTTDTDDWHKVENGIHLSTGLIYADNFDIIRANCTACHSGKLIAQNRADREGWLQMIRWMQETQGLWDLGVNEPKILDYLATHYAPQEVGRRANIDLAAVEWYILELE